MLMLFRSAWALIDFPAANQEERVHLDSQGYAPKEEARMSSSVKFAEFGPFRLFPSERRLVMEGQLVGLGSRALDLLILLVEHAGSVVTKQELIAKAWPGLTVEESSLRVQVASLRKALGNGRGANSYVVNSAGRGYSFVGRVTWHDPPQETAAASIAPRRRETGLPRTTLAHAGA